MARVFAWSIAALGLVLVAALAFVELRNRRGVAEAEAEFAEREPARIADLGATQTLSILPLVDWHTSGPGLRGEMGVSYLVETDEHRILFDVGHNAKEESPSPLEHNMEALGVALDSIDTIFISHNHFDHVGGKQRQRDKTFSIGLEPVPLPGVQVFVPISMTYLILPAPSWMGAVCTRTLMASPLMDVTTPSFICICPSANVCRTLHG